MSGRTTGSTFPEMDMPPSDLHLYIGRRELELDADQIWPSLRISHAGGHSRFEPQSATSGLPSTSDMSLRRANCREGSDSCTQHGTRVPCGGAVHSINSVPSRGPILSSTGVMTHSRLQHQLCRDNGRLVCLSGCQR